MKNLLLLTAIFVIALSSVVSAQQTSLKPAGSPIASGSSPNLVLEISYSPTMPPDYSVVLGADKRPEWIWVSRFIRIPGLEMSPPVEAIKLESQYNGESAGVRVTLLRGPGTGFDREDLVGKYHLGIGEQMTINDLRKYGVQPFSITLLNVVPPLPPPPAFENKTKSIEIVSIQTENLPRPAYKVTFRNLSDKALRALGVEVWRDARRASSHLWQGVEGRSIIEPGGTGERYIPALTTEPAATGFAPGTASSNTIVVRAAVFTDMSFEGESETACAFESFVMGGRNWLKQVLPLLDREVSAPIEDHIEAARQFKEKFSALHYEFDENERNQASAVSPACPKPFQIAQGVSGVLKLQVLRDLDEIITTRPSPPVNFKSWLETRRANYQAWLARL
jgi:hypothetical protein